ncbi:DNA replication protein [Xylanimonas allomyrinae]|uniref:DNA replication protein n=1 Tax=Xylanimonas allomyrinae TaxID=2509459 RepID=A0A4P6EKK5_9MICO|nr:bifunctional DNA primase/polymerase [Xylanimonas allomyrinae]QAY63230.1 DNA replication protein [Xylanimonas allomyrinae]
MSTPADLTSSRLSPLRRAAAAPSLPAAAASLARAGVPVFPCAPTGKQPLTQRGFLDATTDVDQVAAWWRRRPDANIGVPTGERSGFDVVDVDLHPGSSGFPAFERARRGGLVAGWSVVVRTPSGGIHAYFPHSAGVEQRSWQSPRTHIDFRGDGGYVVAPPSWCLTPVGPRRYELVAVSGRDPHPVDAGALRAFLDPPRPTPSPSGAGVLPGVGASPDRLAAWVASRPEGGRNAGLFWASCRMVEGGFDLPSTVGALAEAAQHAGLPRREVEATIRSAFRRTAALPAPGGLRPAPTPEVST